MLPPTYLQVRHLSVTSIKVKENQVVKKGDAIALIDNSQLQSKKS
ncbi:biotin/lipoyl-binding protein [Nostoc sp.]